MSDPCYICGQGSVGYIDTPGYNAPRHTLARCARHMPGWPRAVADQPPPRPSTGDVWQLVVADMEARRQVGIERYGTPLQPNNGRDALVDAYQEALDLCAYLRQAIEERK